MKLFSTHFRLICLAVAGVLFSGLSATKAQAQNPPCQTPETTVTATCCSNDLPYNYNGQTFNQGGTYDVHLTNAQGCDSLVHLNLTVLEGTYATITGNTEICPGSSTQLSANGNGTFMWSTGNNRSPITVNTPGWYVLTVTATNGCVAYDSVEVTLLPLPDVSISGPDTICSGTSALLIASGGYSYSWNNMGVMDAVLIEIVRPLLFILWWSTRCPQQPFREWMSFVRGPIAYSPLLEELNIYGPQGLLRLLCRCLRNSCIR